MWYDPKSVFRLSFSCRQRHMPTHRSNMLRASLRRRCTKNRSRRRGARRGVGAMSAACSSLCRLSRGHTRLRGQVLRRAQAAVKAAETSASWKWILFQTHERRVTRKRVRTGWYTTTYTYIVYTFKDSQSPKLHRKQMFGNTMTHSRSLKMTIEVIRLLKNNYTNTNTIAIVMHNSGGTRNEFIQSARPNLSFQFVWVFILQLAARVCS